MLKRVGIGVSISLNVLLIGIALYVWLGDPFRDFIHPWISQSRISMFDSYPIRQGDVVFLGDSITEGGEWNEMFPERRVRNRGIGGDRTDPSQSF